MAFENIIILLLFWYQNLHSELKKISFIVKYFLEKFKAFNAVMPQVTSVSFLDIAKMYLNLEIPKIGFLGEKFLQFQIEMFQYEL